MRHKSFAAILLTYLLVIAVAGLTGMINAPATALADGTVPVPPDLPPEPPPDSSSSAAPGVQGEAALSSFTTLVYDGGVEAFSVTELKVLTTWDVAWLIIQTL